MRFILLLLILLLSILILWINIQLYSENQTNTGKKSDIQLQLNFLETELKHHNLGERMQQIFPEGYVFVYALYGLAWCELALHDTSDTALKEKAIHESLFAYNALNTEKARSNFPNDLTPALGIFYNGWRNYLLSKILSVDTSFIQSEDLIKTFKQQSDTIITALSQSESPFLESYEGASWPADMFVAMASISNHDKIFNPKYKAYIEKWLIDVRKCIDPTTKNIPHEVDSKTGKTIEGARGSSMGLILRMAGEIDQEFAQEQYMVMKDNFISKTVGLPSIREYPRGQEGPGDYDSGPVIFDIGFSATIVMIGTYAMLGYDDLSGQQYATINAFGCPITSKVQKKYLLGKLPMADTFIAWGRATELNHSKDITSNKTTFWRLQFQFISISILIVLWALFFRKQLTLYFRFTIRKQ